MGNKNRAMTAARVSKRDEFYTCYETVCKELELYISNAPGLFFGKSILCPCDGSSSAFRNYFETNFSRLGLRRLVCTNFSGTCSGHGQQYFDFGYGSGFAPGAFYTIEKSTGGGILRSEGRLSDNGDFRSDEISALRDASDFIITNPPFSLFREFWDWLLAGVAFNPCLRFAVLGGIHAAAYKNVFPLLRDRRAWLGASVHSGDMRFYIPSDYSLNACTCGSDKDGRFINVKGVRWFTNIAHGLFPPPMRLFTASENLAMNRKLRRVLVSEYGQGNGMLYYPVFDNYDVIEVPVSACIPSDYEGIMGVPITFLDVWNPLQFALLGIDRGGELCTRPELGYHAVLTVNGKLKTLFTRLFIKRLM